jgi:hypothetical protein
LSQQRYRVAGVKREHGIVEGLLPILERIAARPDVSAVIPGRIRVTANQVPKLVLRLQVRTVSGFKLGARTRSLAQEVFVTCREPEAVEAILIGSRIIEPR